MHNTKARQDRIQRILYVSRLMKGHEALKAVQDFKAQESIGPTTRRVLQEAGCETCRN